MWVVTVQYRVNEDESVDIAEQIEAQRWQMFQKKYGIEPLELKVEICATIHRK